MDVLIDSIFKKFFLVFINLVRVFKQIEITIAGFSLFSTSTLTELPG
jgi:hypothetical protein